MTISILAVLVAISTLFGHRAHTEEGLVNAQAIDQWAYYQAKNIRLHEVQFMVDLLGTVTTLDKGKTELLREKYQKEVERYESDKGDISEKAKEFERLRFSACQFFDASEGILRSLVICLHAADQPEVFDRRYPDRRRRCGRRRRLPSPPAVLLRGFRISRCSATVGGLLHAFTGG
jgi:hypothetical protein